MSTHDAAHQLARSVQQSREYQEMLRVKESIQDNPAAREMIEDFRLKQLEVQAAQLGGENVPEEKLKQLNALYEILALNPAVKAYLAAEYNLGRLLADVQKIIGDAVGDALE